MSQHYLSGKDSVAGRLVPSLEWWVELTRHTFQRPRRKLCIELSVENTVVIFMQVICNQPDEFNGF